MILPPIRRLRVPDQIAAALRDAILGGSLPPGEPLPSERSLAERFSVNRSSVREALRRLESMGLVQIRQGEATRVQDWLANAGFSLLPWLLAPGGQPDPALLHDLMEIRVQLLAWTADLAARRATPDRLAPLLDAMAQLENAHSAAELQAADWAFFEALVSLSQNRVLGLLSNAVRRVYLENQPLFRLLYAHLDLAPHRAALAAITAGDHAAAAAAMRAHGESAQSAVRASLGERVPR